MADKQPTDSGALPELDAVADEQSIRHLRVTGKDTLCGGGETPSSSGRPTANPETQLEDLPGQLWRLWRSGDRPQVGVFLVQAGPRTPAQVAAVLLVDQRERWELSERVLAETYLREFPQLNDHPEAGLDLVYNEFLLREQRGESPTFDEFQERFPQLGAQLRQQLDFYRALATGSTAEGPDIPAALRGHPRYRVLRRLGAGGMGTVYLAEHRLMHRKVALKLINPDYVTSPRMIDRFRREIAAAARLHHPNIVVAHDAEEVAGVHFLAMEYVEGESLKEYLDRPQPLAVAEACDFIRQAALGLQHALDKGMVHRDIKPHNLMRTPEGQVKILDFGLAVLAAQGPAGDLTGSGAITGTPDYMAPEQTQDAHAADIRADIYSLGCTLYQLLAGRVPFAGRSGVDKLIAHRQEKPPPLENVRPDVSQEVAGVVRRMMAKPLSERFQTPQEVVAALDACPVRQAEPVTAITAAQPRKSRSRRWIAAAMFLLVLGSWAAGVITFTNSQGDEFTITTDDPTIEILVKNRGKELWLIDPTTKQRWKLDTEKYQLSDADRPAGLTIEISGKEPFVLRRGQGDKIASVARTAVKGKPVDLTQEAPELKLVRIHPWYERHAYVTRFSPDGKYYAAGGSANQGEGIRIWETATGNEVITVPGYSALTFSPDSRMIYAATHDDHVIRGWSLSSKKQVHQFKGHDKVVRDLAMTPDGKKLISSARGGTLRFWSVDTQMQFKSLSLDTPELIFRLAPDGKSLIAYDQVELFRLVDVGTGEVSRTWKNPDKDTVLIRRISQDGKEFSTIQGKYLYSWKLGQDEPVRKLALPHISAYCLSADLQWLLYSGDSGSSVRLLHLATGKIHGRHDLAHQSLGQQGFSPDGRFAVFSVMLPSSVYVFEMPKELWVKKGP